MSLLKTNRKFPLKIFRGIFFSPLLFGWFFILMGCFHPVERQLSEAKSLSGKGQFVESLVLYEKILVRYKDNPWALESLIEISRILFFELKEYERAVEFYRHLVVRSPDQDERIFAQKQIAEIYFDHLQNYPQAIFEINKLLGMLVDPFEKIKIQKKLARAYFYQQNFFQASNEVDQALQLHNLSLNSVKEKNNKIHGEDLFDLLLLKANIFVGQKNFNRAVDVYKNLIVNFPELSKKENVWMSLAVCYEEIQDFKNAILVLEEVKSYHPTPEYIQGRIRKMLERQKNLPNRKKRGFR